MLQDKGNSRASVLLTVSFYNGTEGLWRLGPSGWEVFTQTGGWEDSIAFHEYHLYEMLKHMNKTDTVKGYKLEVEKK
jgi:hypothetical protein